MSQFQIKAIAPEAEQVGGAQLYGTGKDAIFCHTDVIRRRKISEKDGGIYKFVTGLTESDINNCRYLTREEKAQYLTELPTILEKLEGAFGKEGLENTNKHFWEQYGTITVDNDSLKMYYSDDSPETLLLRCLVRGGAFDIIAPTIDGAKHNMVPYYITDIETEAERKYEKRGGKPQAFAAYENLKTKTSRDALVYISWVLHEKTKGYTKKSAPHIMYQAIEEYIDGEFTKVGKKECPKRFCELAERWKTDKENLILEASVHAAEFYGFLYVKDGVFHTLDEDFPLGKNIKDSMKVLFDPRNRAILLRLKELVDEKLDK